MDSWVLYVLGALWLRGLLSYPRALLSCPSQGPDQRRRRFLLERRRRSARLP